MNPSQQTILHSQTLTPGQSLTEVNEHLSKWSSVKEWGFTAKKAYKCSYGVNKGTGHKIVKYFS